MPIDITPSRVATQQLQMIPFGSLIGAPLDAAITAQGQAAMTSAEFIRSVGLQQVEVVDSGGNVTKVWEAITVAFTISDSSGITRNLVVPLLAIVPIPYIAIDNVNINFKANISAESSTSLSTNTSTQFGAEAEVSVNYWFVKANFKASYSSKKDSAATAKSRYSVEYTMDVAVNASQADMPGGLASVLLILNDNVVARDPTGDLIVTMDQSPTLNAVDETLKLTIVVVNGDNRGIGARAITATSDDPAILEVTGTVDQTNAYGLTHAVLTVKQIPDTPQKIAVEITSGPAPDEHTETLEVTVG